MVECFAMMLLWFQATASGDVPLSVSLSVPACEDVRRIDATGPQPHFHVLIGNRSGSTLRIWNDTFSWGYYAIHFEVVDASGHISVVRKKQVSFTRNFPAWWKLQPGEQLPIDVHFGDGRTWEQPPTPSRGCTAVTLRAVFEVSSDIESERYGIWTGRSLSPPEKVELCR